MSINWKQKLTSRKLWAALIALITTIIVAIFKADIPADIVKLIGNGVIALCCYIFGESFVDVAREIWNKATTVTTITENTNLKTTAEETTQEISNNSDFDATNNCDSVNTDSNEHDNE